MAGGGAGSAPPRRPARAPLVVAMAVALVVLLAAAACSRWPVPVGFAERLLAERFGRTVRIDGDASFCLYPRPSVRAAWIEVGAPGWSRQPYFARASDVELALSWRSLAGRRVGLASLVLGRGELLLERTEDGRTSWSFPEGRKAADTDGGAPPEIDRFEALDVRWRLLDPSRGADLQGTLSMTDGSGPAADPPRLAVRATGRLRDLPVEAVVEGGGVLPGARPAQRPLKVDATVGTGRLALEGEVDSLASLAGLRGAFRVTGPALAALGGLFGAVLPRTPPFAVAGEVRHAGEQWRVDVTQGRIGQSDLRGAVVFVPRGADRPARLEGRLDSRRMRIADLGRSVGFGERQTRRDRVLPDVSLDIASLRNMDAQLSIAIARLEPGGGVSPVTGLAADLQLRGGVLALGRMQADVAGGRLGGDLRIDASKAPGATQIELRLANLALERWLPRLRGMPPLASRLNAQVRLSGRGDSVAAVLGSADGRIHAGLGPGYASRLMLEVAGLDVAESLSVLVTEDERIRLDCGLFDIALERGVARPKVMLLDTRDTVLVGEGSTDLSKERLALTVRAAPRDASPLTLRSPLRVSGTFADPEIGIDKGRVAGTVIASAVLGTLVAPLAALLPLLDFGEGNPPSPCHERFAGPPAGAGAGTAGGAKAAATRRSPATRNGPPSGGGR